MRRICLALVAAVMVGSGFIRAAQLELDLGARIQPMPLDAKFADINYFI